MPIPNALKTARLIDDGFVRVNGQRADAPSKALAVGDVVTVAAQHVTAAVRVLDLGTRRGPAPEARLLYADLSAEASAGTSPDGPV